jgi:serine/threonine protein phosphatase PrpC
MSILIAAGVTHVGKVRTHNEDSFLVEPDEQVFIVADGMGGHAAGEIASRTAVESVERAWSSRVLARRREVYAENGDRDARRGLVQAVRKAVTDAHLTIVEQARADESKAGMGTTFTGFVVAGGDAIFAHAGDSRAYLVRDGIAMQLSEDHTVLARMRASGAADVDSEENHSRWQGVLTNALGIGDATRVATFVVPLYSGDRFLLCSDGVYEYLEEAEVGSMMVEAPSPARAAQSFVDKALERGGGDNATAVVIKVMEAGETKIPPEQRARDEKAVAECPLFAELSPQERLRALRICIWRELKPGKTLAPVALGERVTYIMLEGEAKGPRGTLGPGAVIYPEALVGDTPMPERSARVVAQETVRLLTIRRDDFMEITEEESDLGVKLYAAVARLMSAR